MTIFWDYYEKIYFVPNNSFLALFRKLSIFREQWRIWLYLQYYTIFTLYYQYLGKDCENLRSPWQNCFCLKKWFFWLYFVNYRCFGNNVVFDFILYTINISEKIAKIWDHLGKIDFVSKNGFLTLFRKLSIFRSRCRYFQITVKKFILTQKMFFFGTLL